MIHTVCAPAVVNTPVSLVTRACSHQEATGLRSISQKGSKASFSPLLALAPGPTQVVRSSSDQQWQGLLLEKHRTAPGERPATILDRPVLVLLCRRSARFEYRTESGSWRQQLQHSDSVTVLPAGPIPEARLQTPAEFIGCVFENDLLHSVAEGLKSLPHRRPVFQVGLQDRAITRLLYLLLEELEAEIPLGRLYADFLAHALATRYLLLGEGSAVEPLDRIAALPPRLLRRVQEKIEANMHTDLSLASLAEETGYSRAHFLRMFRSATGLTPHQYVLDLRLKRAQECLKQANSRIIDVALSCGFSSQSHMTTAFRRHCELTPGKYRRTPEAATSVT